MIGTRPHLIPANENHGSAASMDWQTMPLTNAQKDALAQKADQVSQYPLTQPDLFLDFTTGKIPDGRITTSRNTQKICRSRIGYTTYPADTPAFSYDPVGDCYGLDLEGGVENRVQISTPNTANWTTLTSTPIATNAALSPRGLMEASRIDTTTAGYTYYTFTGTAGTRYTFSYFYKLETATSNRFSVYDVTNAAFIVNSTLANGYPVGEGWFRQEVSFTAPAGSQDIRVYPWRDATGTQLIWGCSVEALGFATSPVLSVSPGTSTRGIEYVNLPLGEWFNPYESTWIIDFNTGPAVADVGQWPWVINFVNGTDYSQHYGLYFGMVDRAMNFRLRNSAGVNISGAVSSSGTGTVQPNTRMLAGFSLTRTGIEIAYSNDVVRSMTFTDTPALPTEVRFGRGDLAFNGRIYRLWYFRRKLPTAELSALVRP